MFYRLCFELYLRRFVECGFYVLNLAYVIMAYIGIDIGGTSIKSVLLQGSGHSGENIQIESKKHSHTSREKSSLISEITTHLEQYFNKVQPKNIKGIGLGSPGPLDKKREKFLEGLKPELSYVENVSLKKELQKTSLLQKNPKWIYWERDANLFTFAETVLGKGQKATSVLGLTLGTGLGGGWAFSGQNAKIWEGEHGSAGEIGHMIIQENGLECYCGQQGCLEQYTSQQFLERHSPGKTATQLHKKAEASNSAARSILEEMGYYLGLGLTNLVDLLDPEVVVLGGGLLEYTPNIIHKKAVETVRGQTFSPTAGKNIEIEVSELGEYGGAIGAALYARQRTQKAPR